MSHNIHSSLWGPGTWFFLQTLAYTYPENPTTEKQQKTLTFLQNLILPCLECETNWINLITANSPVVDSRDNFMTWIYQIRQAEAALRNLPSITQEAFYHDLNAFTDMTKYGFKSTCTTCASLVS